MLEAETTWLFNTWRELHHTNNLSYKMENVKIKIEEELERRTKDTAKPKPTNPDDIIPL